MSQILIDALTKIAAFNDTEACKYLERTGRFGRFDEPGAVEEARKALVAHTMLVDFINTDGGMPAIDAAAQAIYDGPVGDENMPVRWGQLHESDKDQFRMAARIAIVAFFNFGKADG